MAWREIGTAPKDGRAVYAEDADEWLRAWVVPDGRGGWKTVSGDQKFTGFRASHWWDFDANENARHGG